MSSNYQFTNNAATTLASSILIGATSLTVASGTGGLFPTLTGSNFFYCTLQNTAGTVIEIVKVTARSTDTFTIVRAQEGTSASAFSTGDKVELRLTAGEINLLFSGVTLGSGTDQVFHENGLTVNTSYTLTTSRNAMSVGPISIASGASVTIPSGARWVVL
jgi:hypothetical protein